ncbi:MAG: DUF1573 domain-containing protein [Cytophagales bacterium]|nr:MAG: DUF1573 domain-containing protein [Cytophagales bacterium]TAF59818.1 MAG: DUF1573 domain-containing protein [Cytophagales bacterium]
MSKVLLSSFLLSVLVLMLSFVPVPAEDASEISFNEVSYDFGSVREGRVVEKVFVYKNTGNLPLILTGVRTTCGCTATEWSQTPLEPGKSAQIKVKFDTMGKVGKQNKSITIISNAKTPAMRLALMGMVLPAE